MYDRRRFNGMLAAAAAAVSFSARTELASEPTVPFHLRYAPHFGMFEDSAGPDLVDQLRFAADQGFTAWEDNPMKDRDVALQTRIANEMEQLNMHMGVISALRGVWKAVNFTGEDRSARQQVLQAIKDIVPVAKRVHATYLTVVPGLSHPKLPEGFQFANCIELLHRCCDIIEPHGCVMVLEPLNTKTNHPGVYLSRSDHAFQLCRAVARPGCKMLFDIYHQQISEGNLIPNLDRCWSEIAYLQTGDNPGRKEPGTGEIDYHNVFQHIAKKGYRGIVGMEHGVAGAGAAGEKALVEAYREFDPELAT